MHRITLRNTNGSTATINPQAPYSEIKALVETVVDVHNYAFDGDAYDEDVEMIGRMVQASRVMALRLLLEDTDMSVSL